MAAGLTVAAERIDALAAFLNDRLAAETAQATLEDTVEIDALITPGAADRALLESFNRLAPFGPGNPEPMFAMEGVRPQRGMVMRGGHVRCDLSDVRGRKIKAIAWRSADTPLGQRLLGGESSLNIVGRLKPDDWNGRDGVQLEIEDASDPRQV